MQFLAEKQRFQFYDSPIKRVIQCKLSPKNKGFNSMIVRLKANISGAVSYILNSFNSMIVRLKAVRNDKKHY